MHRVIHLLKKRWVEYKTKPGSVGFLIIYVIEGMHKYGRCLPILILYFFSCKKMNMS